jgi:diguanylate cyclase (GGDEF)-like protein/PAS domain S-box-containing protein
MKKFLNNINITQKFIGYLLLLSVLPLLVMGIFSYQFSSNILRQETIDFTDKMVQHHQEYLHLQLEQIDNLMANIASVEAINDVLILEADDSSSYHDLATQAQIGYILNNYSNITGLVSIHIFSLQGTHYNMGDTLNVGEIDQDVLDRLFQETIASKQEVYWAGIEPNVNVNSTTKKVITAAKLLTKVDTESLEKQPLALLVVNLDIDDFNAHLSDAELDSGSYFMVLDTKNRVTYHPDVSIVGSRVTDSFMDNIKGSSGHLEDVVNGERMSISYNRSARNGWVTLSMVPLKVLRAKAAVIGIQTFGLLLLCLLVMLVIAQKYSRDITLPIRQVTDHFKSLRAGRLDLATRMPVQGNDEIGQLKQWFNAFMESLTARQEAEKALEKLNQELEDRVKDRTAELKQTNFKLLDEIDERKVVEDELRKSEERYALAAQGANDGLWDWQINQEAIYFSERWKAMVGKCNRGVGNNPQEWFDLVHPDDLPELNRQISSHLQGLSDHFECEYLLQYCDGEYRWMLSRGLAVRDDRGMAYRMVGSQTDIDKRKNNEFKLIHDAMHDPLTDLPNRALLMDRLSLALARRKRHDQYQFALMFIDLDRFKVVNDSLGHLAGDDLLRVVATRFQNSIRSLDTVARLGGDEFVILLEDFSDVHQVIHIANRLQEQLSLPMSIGGQAIYLTASIGITLSTTGNERPEDMLRDADTAMYRAKQLGRGRHEIFDKSMHNLAMKHMQTEMELRRAIEKEEFVVYYQPVVSLDHGKVKGFEALVRWQHPEKGLIMPDNFIPVAEESGLVAAIDLLVLREACSQMHKWHTRYPNQEPKTISVNLSSLHFTKMNIIEQIDQVLKETGLPAKFLDIEITERTIIMNNDMAMQIIQALSERGIHLHLDDFGTGYSSLSYLHRFPFNAIKVDRSFVGQIDQKSESKEIVRTIINLAKTMGMGVIAEGIELWEQIQMLSDMDCHVGQGYFFSKPVAAGQAETMFEGNKSLP